MLILVTYDVSTVEKAGQRRLRRVAQACKDYGVRVQKSVFECQVGQMEWVSLRDRLLREIKGDEDSLRSLRAGAYRLKIGVEIPPRALLALEFRRDQASR